MRGELLQLQKRVCDKYGSPWVASEDDLKVGIARNVGMGLHPINGWRHPPSGDTTGWYIWAGEEVGSEEDFFQPMHVKHLAQECPAVLPYLGLSPGWRFLIAPGYEDVWNDPSLLDASEGV